MRAGDLVRIKRASIGIPMDTLGLVTAEKKLFDRPPDEGYNRHENEAIWEVQMLGTKPHARRYMSRDLEVISENR
jgi:hypothetical protein